MKDVGQHEFKNPSNYNFVYVDIFEKLYKFELIFLTFHSPYDQSQLYDNLSEEKVEGRSAFRQLLPSQGKASPGLGRNK